MKTKIILFASLLVVSVGACYLFSKKKPLAQSDDLDPVGPILHEETGQQHIRQVFHKAKETSPEMVVPGID